MTTRPSMMMSEARVPVKRSPCWVVALSRVSVMRMGMVVSGGIVMLRKVGAGGGGGGAGGRSCTGGGGGGAAATSGAGAGASAGGGGAWRTIGAGFFLVGAGVCFGFGATGVGAGGGVAAATTAGTGAWTVRLLTTVLMPATWEASAAARERAASLLTLPFRVAMRF